MEWSHDVAMSVEDLLMLFFIARLHEVHRAIVVISVVRVYVYVLVRVTLSVEVFRSLYLWNM